MKKINNYAFIDGQNVNLAIKELGWKLDLKKFRRYLTEKYNVQKAYYFIGHLEENSVLYKNLQEYGYILIFKPTYRNKEGMIKGNCDAELVLQAMIDLKDYDQAVIVTGDGDFGCLVSYLILQKKLRVVVSPNRNKCSWLLRKAAKSSYLVFMNNLENKLSYKIKKKVP